MKPSTGAPVRNRRNAVRDQLECLSAIDWNRCPRSLECCTCRQRLCARRVDGLVRGERRALSLRIGQESAFDCKDLERDGGGGGEEPADRQAGALLQGFRWTTLDSWSRERRVIGKAEFTAGEANPRFVVTSLKRSECKAKYLYEKIYCARGDMENRIKECQLDLYADRTSTATMRANQLRLWFASMAYVLMCAVRRIGLDHTPFAKASCGTIRLKLLKIGALVRISVRRIKIAMASGCPAAATWSVAALRLNAAAQARGSPA